MRPCFPEDKSSLVPEERQDPTATINPARSSALQTSSASESSSTSQRRAISEVRGKPNFANLPTEARGTRTRELLRESLAIATGSAPAAAQRARTVAFEISVSDLLAPTTREELRRLDDAVQHAERELLQLLRRQESIARELQR